jgi:hypothetical protein
MIGAAELLPRFLFCGWRICRKRDIERLVRLR